MTIASDNSVTAATAPKRGQYSLAWRIRKGTATISRWLHIYLSMVSFAVVFFFAVTGITLNHAEWFSHQAKTKDYRGSIPASLLHERSGSQPDKLQPDRLGIVELLRNRHKIHGSVSDFRVEVWSIVIDVAASLLVLVSLSGLVLICFVYKRRTAGLILAAASGILCLLVYLAFVP